MMAENSHLISKMPERETGLPNTYSPGYAGLGDVLETLARLPSSEEILGLRPATQLQDRIEELLAKNRAGGLSAEEQREWERYEYIEHLVRLAKVRAIQRQAQR